jgi:ABC-type Na+ efflux pump permease subunit
MTAARVGKVLALVSPALAVGVVCLMLFATGYSYVSMEERAGPEGDPVETASESGWVSAYEYSLENDDYVYLLWSGSIAVIGLLAAGAALKG